MGGTAARQSITMEQEWTSMELYNLKQVYFFLCLHTTTLTSCQLTVTQWDSLLHRSRSAKLPQKAIWRSLFQAICSSSQEEGISPSGELSFTDFLRFIRIIKRGTTVEQRWLCFRCWDTDNDGVVEKADFKRVVDAKAILFRQTPQADDEISSFFALVDEKLGDRFEFEAFKTYCSVYGDGVVNSTLKIFELMFDQCIDETGISITSTDVKNSKPHIDWQDHKIRMTGLLCCSSLSPMFTKAPAIA